MNQNPHQTTAVDMNTNPGDAVKAANPAKTNPGDPISPIRRARDDDTPDITRLLFQVLEVHHNGRPDLFKSHATKYNQEQLRDIIHNDNTPVFVYPDENDHVLGYAFCVFQRKLNDNILTDIQTLYIDDLCVDESRRQSGIGQALFEYVRKFAKESGCYNLTLNVWAANINAMKFYQKQGLVPQKTGLEIIL